MLRGKKNVLMLAALAGLPASALAQSPIATLPPNNGSGGVFLQLTPTGSALTVDSFASYFSSAAGTPVNVEVWVRPGAYAGFTASNAGWVLSETAVATSAGTTTLSGNVVLANSIVIPAGGPTSIYLHATTAGGGIRYQGTGTTSTTTFSNADVTLFSDVSRTGAVPFGGTQFTPRAFSGTIGYTLGGVTGRCCLASGACVVTTSANCTNLSGTYAGDGTDCVVNVCPQPPTGACCFFASCSVVSQAACTAGGGTYQGDNTACGSCPAVPPVIYSNCNLSTGPLTLSGVAAPAGSLWSECAKDEVEPGLTNTVAGFGSTGALRLADDFVVPAGGMNVAYIKVFAYTTGAVSVTNTGATLRILDGSPLGTPNVVFGDQTTNRMAHAGFTDIYRIFPTTVGLGSGSPCVNGAATAPGTTRRLQEIYITVNQFLPAGTYWVDYNTTGTSFAPPATQSDAIGRACDPNNSNALQFNVTWVPLNDDGHGCVGGVAVNNPAGTNPISVQQDMYFEVLGTLVGGGCYANCDQSTGNPLLTANDFQCFLNKYAANDTYANCDGSTGNPLLTANDFQCFLNKFAAGCT